MSDFVDWVDGELNKRDWNRNQLSIRSGVNSGLLTRIMNRERNAGPDTLTRIAQAFDLPPEIVFRKAGMLPEKTAQRINAEEIVAYKMADLTERQLDEVIRYIDFIQERDEEMPPITEPAQKRTREGSAPPEAVKE